jgi:hypothetical protein
VHDVDPVAHVQDLGQLRRDHQDGCTLLHQLVHELVNLCLGTHIDPAGRLIEDEKPGLRAEPFRQHHLLLGPPAQELGHPLDGGRGDVQRLHEVPHHLVLPARLNDAGGEKTAQARHHHILPERHDEGQSLALPILRQKAHADGDTLAGGAMHRTAEDADLSAIVRVCAEDGARQLRPSCAYQPCQPDDLTASDGQVDVVQDTLAVEVPDGHRHFPLGSREFPGEEPLDVSPHHRLDDGVHARVLHIHGGNPFSVPQDRDPIPDLEDLLQSMGDIDDTDTAGLQPLDRRKELLDLAGRQGGGRLVHDHDLRLHRERLGHLYHLLLRDAQVVDRGLRIDVHPERFKDRPALGLHARGVDEAGNPGVPRLSPQEDVLGHAQKGHQVELLVDDTDAQGQGLSRSLDHGRLAIDDDSTLVVPVSPGQDLDQGGLARAVFPDQHVNLAAPQVEAHIVQGLDPRKLLADPLELEHHFFSHHPFPRSAARFAFSQAA